MYGVEGEGVVSCWETGKVAELSWSKVDELLGLDPRSAIVLRACVSYLPHTADHERVPSHACEVFRFKPLALPIK